jgi:DNA helicase-2/ATP-dependent DNA helicase PcrA
MKNVLIVAGAGTGKTNFISDKVKDWIEEGVDSSKILCLTFSNEAAANLKKRIAEKTGAEVFVETFHGFCSWFLKESGFKFRILTEYLQVLRIYRLGVDKNTAGLYAKTINKCKNMGLNFKDYKKFLESLEEKLSESGFTDLEKAYDDYFVDNLTGVDVSKLDFFAEDFKRLESYKKFLKFWEWYELKNAEQGLLDYEDLQLKAIEFLKERNIAFTHTAVDEFQDVDSNQLELLKLIGRNSSIAVVADQNQSIYGFRGAKSDNIDKFEVLFKPEKITLNKNYRSTNSILKSAFNVIKNNGKGILLESDFNGEKVKVVECETPEGEAAFVASEILKLKDFSSIGVLYRYRHHSTILKKELERLEIPFELIGSDMLNTQIVKEALAYLQVANNLEAPTTVSELSFLKILELNGADKKTIKQLSDLKKKRKINLKKIISDNLVEVPDLESLKSVVRRLEYLRVEGIYGTLKKTCELFDLTKPYSLRDDRRSLSDFNDFELFVKDFESENSSLSDFLDFVEIARNGSVDVEGKPSTGETIKLMTIHAAKGLEFEAVFILNASKEGFFPNHKQSDLVPLEFYDSLKNVLGKKYVYKMTRDNDLKYALKKEREGEERRLFYVAMTRARKNLYICYPLKSKRDFEPVIFINELGEHEIIKSNLKPAVVEKEVKDSGLKVNSFSFSSIESYLKCPKYFEFKHLLGFETEPSKPLLLGTFVHDLLKEAKDISSFDDLQKLFETRNKGFDRREVLRMLKVFWERNKDTLKNIIKTEDFFSIDLEGFKFTGRIDRFDKVGDGIEVIDYKTGSPPLVKVQLMQLGLYALALRQRGLNPKTLKIESLKEKTVSYQLKEDNITGKNVVESLDSIKQRLVSIAKRINSDYNNYFPCNVGYQCATCEYRLYCNES